MRRSRPAPSGFQYPYDRPTRAEVVLENREEYTDHGINQFRPHSARFEVHIFHRCRYRQLHDVGEKLKRGLLPAWEGVRVEEFVNYFEYDYAAPRRRPFAVHMESMPDPTTPREPFLRIGASSQTVQSPNVHRFISPFWWMSRVPCRLPINGIGEESMHTLVSSLREGDTVAMATYAGRVARILGPTDVVRSSTIHRAIDSLHSGGSTAMSSGIDLTYEMADEALSEVQRTGLSF